MKALKKPKHEISVVVQTAFKVSVVFVAALVIIVALFTVYIMYTMKIDILKEKEIQTQTIADTIETDIDSLTNPMISLANYDPVTRLLNEYNEKYTQGWMQDIRNMDTYLNNINLFYDYVLDIVLVRSDGRIVYSMSDRVDMEYDFIGQKWFQDAMLQKQMIKYIYNSEADFFYENSVDEALSAIYPVYEEDEIQGYVVCEYSMSSIKNYFLPGENPDCVFLLTDEESNIIYNLNKSISDEKLEEFKLELTEKSSEGSKGTFQYDKNLYTYHTLNNCGWNVLSENTIYTINAPVYKLIILVTVVFALTLVCLIILTLYSTQKIKRPYDFLIGRIVSFDGNNSLKDYECNYEEAPKEIYTIGMKFEQMAENIKTLIQDVYIAELNKKEMELEVMVNQINPHFLYNVFQLIQTEAVLNDNETIEVMIQKLSEMLRYTMERKRDKVKIKEEVKYIENYLMFYKERFENMFEYHLEYNMEVLEYDSIKFILQPVVENCFKHGLKNKTKDGEIDISVKKEREEIIFSVYDNGMGISKEKLEAIRRNLEDESKEGGIGIINTNHRIKIAYGDSSGITFESEEGKYTRVLIKIKAERNK